MQEAVKIQEERKVTKADFRERLERIREQRVALAAEDNARVRRVDNVDTAVLLDIQPAADRCFTLIRRYQGIYPRYSHEATAPLIADWYRIMMELHGWTEKASALTGVRYRVPRVLREILGAGGAEGGEAPAAPGEAPAAPGEAPAAPKKAKGK